MSTTEPAALPRGAQRVIDARFAKVLVVINGLVPAALLMWDGIRHQLGANEVNFAIRTTGMVGLVLLVLSLLITPLRKLTGWNTLIAIRRNLGVLGFSYLVTHFTIFWILDREGSLASTAEEIVTRVYLWFGTTALVLMIPLAVTSTDGMVRRLGAARWKRLHRLSYPIAICGVVHYYLLVKSDVRQPLAFAIVVGALLAYRVVRQQLDLRAELKTARARLAQSRALAPAPRRRFWSGELTVARIFRETHDIKTFRLVATDGGPLPFDHVAGQYLNVALAIDGGAGQPLVHDRVAANPRRLLRDLGEARARRPRVAVPARRGARGQPAPGLGARRPLRVLARAFGALRADRRRRRHHAADVDGA